MVADDAFVYWTDGSTIQSAPAQGGTASWLAGPATVGDLALDADGSLFWVERQTDSRTGAIHRMQSRVDRVVVANAAANYGLALGDTYVYFTVTAGAPC